MTLLPINALEKTLNRYLNLDAGAPQLLMPLVGKVMGLHIKRPKIAIYFSFHEKGIQLSTEVPETINTEIYTTLFQLMRLKWNKSSSLVNTQFYIQGDVETAQRFHELFEKHHIDWEEHLSKLMGDVTAYKMVQVFQKASKFGKRNHEKFKQDITEYCQEEALLFPSSNEVEIFRREVEALRLHMDRLEARLEVLKNKL